VAASCIPALVPADFSRVDPRAVALLAERWARRHAVLPIALESGTLVVATSEPNDLDTERAVSFATGRRVRWVSAPADEIARQINRWYPDGATRRVEVAAPVQVEHLAFGAESAPAGNVDPGASVIRLVDQLIADGIAAGASDIHLEPEEQGIAVRHRVDGMLRQVGMLPRALAPSLVSRVKILSGVDIADRLRPQDGRARVAVRGAVVDLRVSTLPASHGEKVVIRVLDARAGLRSLDGVGFTAPDLRRIRGLLEQREGLLLVTGPTGSGKTTTLYAALREIQTRGVNVVTVEDPIEYRLPGIVQVQVHERAGLTFSKALRSIMRQDPDVILVGEIRDRETAEIAIQASLTGHLVLSTLHTNDAASAVTRLIDIGVASYRIATALKGIVAQRLVRRACASCHGRGCDACDGAGYRGRLAVAEILVVTPEFERRVAAGVPTESLVDAARTAGCVSLWDSGLTLVRTGQTTIDELRRVAAEPVRAVAEPLPATALVHGQRQERPAPEPAASDPVGGPGVRRVGGRASSMTTINIGTVDVYLIEIRTDGWRVLALQRSRATRCPNSWETVHGHIEAGEQPEDAALREVREETGLEVERLYNVCVQPFYLHKRQAVELAVVFAGFVSPGSSIRLGEEHTRSEWLTPERALERFAWPRERQALRDILHLLKNGDAGTVEDVARVK
jgi:type II secretory ATPase GspE/PulE/Tfp pilus assembly ATPase PilB-like protein/8-oxo-dGTP pyrophosphatase MutT (NUDIX family)